MRLSGFMFLALSLTAPVHAEPDPPEARRTMLQTIVNEIETSYIDPDRVRHLGAALRTARLQAPMGDEEFAHTLTDILRTLTADPHLRLMYSAEPAAAGRAGAPSPEDIARREARLRAQNYGIARVERLPGNIGYLKTHFFAPATPSAPSIGAAMTLLANTDALIIDLRDNDGGATDAVPLLASYLFDERTHIADLYTRKGNITQQQWTSPAVPGVRFGGRKDVYLLTSKSTFSAAEGFAFALRNRGRVTIVGETTRGGAHPSRIAPVSAHLALMVPTSTARDPVTRQDWEGVGVAPDVATAAADALTRAQILILDELQANKQDAALQAEIRARREELAAQR